MEAMISIDNIRAFFDNNPEFEEYRDGAMLRANKYCEACKVIPRDLLSNILGNLKPAFLYDMDNNFEHVRISATLAQKNRKIA